MRRLKYEHSAVCMEITGHCDSLKLGNTCYAPRPGNIIRNTANQQTAWITSRYLIRFLSLIWLDCNINTHSAMKSAILFSVQGFFRIGLFKWKLNFSGATHFASSRRYKLIIVKGQKLQPVSFKLLSVGRVPWILRYWISFKTSFLACVICF